MPTRPKLPIPFAGEFRMKLLHRVTPVAMAFGALLLAVAAQAADTIKIGIPQPMTGPNNQYGTPTQAGRLTALQTNNTTDRFTGNTHQPILITTGCVPTTTTPAHHHTLTPG